ncbi:glycosyltransferase family 2 protein [Haloplasma contractile]|uniref:Rhamnosyl transferase rfbQ protein n=1 Tax=Haloplasma contractile SSD-17B TaxID=1033810 RepID=U2E791_9MOLU|nr:glycosyltransferase family 2 protein [Haloplasma contractile]ERJ11063.1 Rhamnosyl transferase rfbQ protein [Haloplasma contractile SSD-17B]
MSKLGFIIVQYNNYEDTINCIESINQTMKQNDYYIVVVDNDSPNDAYIQSKNIFESNEHVYVVQANDNLGYATGANFGVKEILNVYEPDIICVLNNDIIFKTDDLLKEVHLLSNPYDIIAPNIFRKYDGIPQNPQPTISYSLSWINTYVFFYRLLSFFHIFYLDFIPFYLAVKVMGRYYAQEEIDYSEEQFINKAHGSCIFFTKEYVDRYKGNVMHPDTFLFLEEDFLSLRCKLYNQKILFAPSLKIIHLEDHSMDSIFKNFRKKRKFVYKNHLKSFKAFKKYYKRNRKSIERV